MVKDYVTVQEVAEILDIELCSAEELLDGTIEFEADELFEISQVIGVSVKQLIS